MVELHPDESQLSSEDSAGPDDVDKLEEDQGLKIRRTVTQVRVLWQLLNKYLRKQDTCWKHDSRGMLYN